VFELLKGGANPGQKDNKRRIPLQYAARSKNLALLNAFSKAREDSAVHNKIDHPPRRKVVSFEEKSDDL
jgi:hypothetical protein